MSTLKALIFVLLCSLSTIVVAQQYIGLKGGLPRSTSDYHFDLEYNGIDGIDYKPTTIFISIFAELGQNPHYTFAPDIHFVQHGNRLPIDSLGRITNQVSYVGTGLINRFKIFSNEYEVYGLLGPQFKLAIRARSGEEILDIEEINLKRIDMNLRTGFGFSKVNENYKILIEWVYDFPFFDINSSSSFANVNRTRGFLIGLQFRLKEKEK